jgi:hypothetical protein
MICSRAGQNPRLAHGASACHGQPQVTSGVTSGDLRLPATENGRVLLSSTVLSVRLSVTLCSTHSLMRGQPGTQTVGNRCGQLIGGEQQPAPQMASQRSAVSALNRSPR